MILGLVPARGGSRGIPRKNLAELGGHPLISHTLRAATAARRLGAVVVTTDDAAIADEARAWDVEVIRRPPALASSRTPMIAAVLHTLDVLAARGTEPEAVTLLQPTSPFRSARHIDAAVGRFVRARAASLVSVTPVSEHPCECVRPTRTGLRPAVASPNGSSRRQQLPPFFYLNGAIYITRTAMLRRRRRFWDRASLLYVMPPLTGVDIDHPDQLAIARAMVAARPDLIGGRA
jgi:CMP-N-acetylneuraminic acid synthetase